MANAPIVFQNHVDYETVQRAERFIMYGGDIEDMPLLRMACVPRERMFIPQAHVTRPDPMASLMVQCEVMRREPWRYPVHNPDGGAVIVPVCF